MFPDQKRAHMFADLMKSFGFTVYLAENGTYGFVTDETETRVLSFSTRDGSLSGNYSPPSNAAGTGWRLEATMSDLTSAKAVREALHASPPPYCKRGDDGWKRFTTVAEHLKMYGASSRFYRV